MTTTQEFPPAHVQRERFAAARAAIVSLMDEHGLLAAGWSFGWDNGRNRYGACHYHKKRLTLSKYLVALNPEEMTEEIARHEVAHALTPVYVERIKNGRRTLVKAGHGPEWKANAQRLGIVGDRCHSGETVQGRYVGNCDRCGDELNKHRMQNVSDTYLHTKRAATGHRCGGTIRYRLR